VSREKRNFGALLGPNPNATPGDTLQEASGRQKGKRSNPDYVQVGAHIPKELHKQVRRRLFDEERDMGDLMTELLQEWMRR
jgi:hypothetical protein